MIFNKLKLSGRMGFVKRDKILGTGLSTAVGLVMITLMVLLIVYKRVPPQIPFFYTRPWGEAQITGKQGLLIFGGGVLTIGFMGSFVSLELYKRDRTLSRMVVWCLVTTFFLALLSVITVWLRVGR